MGRRATYAAATLSTALLIAGCGGGSLSASSAPGGVRSDATGAWLASDATSVDLLQLTESKDGVIAGSINDAEAAPTDSDNPVKVTTLSVTGVRHGNSIALTVNAGLGITQTWNGTFGASKITLQVPQSDGSIASESLKPSSTSKYNEAVDALRAQVVKQQQTAAEQRQAAQIRQQREQAAAEQEQQRQDAGAALSKAKTDLAGAVTQLRTDLAGLGITQQLAVTLAATQSAVSQTQIDEDAVKAMSGSSASCDAISQAIDKVSQDVDAVSSTIDSLGEVVDNVKSAASTVGTDVDSAVAAEQALKDAGGAVDPAIAWEVGRAGQQQSAAATAADSDYSQAQNFYSQSEQIYSSAAQYTSACNVGA